MVDMLTEIVKYRDIQLILETGNHLSPGRSKLAQVQTLQISGFIPNSLLWQLQLYYFNYIHHSFMENPTQIIIQKRREKQIEQIISQQQRASRMNFYTCQFNNTLKQKAGKEEQQVIQLFIRPKYDQNVSLTINPYELGKLQKYKDQIKQLERKYNTMEQKLKQESKKRQPIQKMIELKYSTLQLIRIQYQQKINEMCNSYAPYTVSAFQLFEVVHNNKSLNQMTIKGVLVQQFKEFLQKINPSNSIKDNEQIQQPSWVKEFSPSKNLKIAIDARLQFYVYNKKQCLSQINNLTFFSKLVCWLSDIQAIISLGSFDKYSEWAHMIEQIWKTLILIKKIRIKLWGAHILDQSIQAVRPFIFGALSSLKEVSQLSFEDFMFSPYVSLNNFLAVQESLRILFENNRITHLKLNRCKLFPIISTITLQSISLQTASFRKNNDCLGNIIKSNPYLKDIRCYQRLEQWELDEQLINQLQTLAILRCLGINHNNFEAQTPSNIKNLSIWSPDIRATIFLMNLFPKLSSLTYLSLHYINFGDQFLAAIPSSCLQDLSICYNNFITNRGIQQIDIKWPYLSHLIVKQCINLTQSVWSHCSFKGLLTLSLDKTMLKAGMKGLICLKRQGIKISYY